MKDILKPGLILMAYGIIAGLALGLVNSMTAPKIAAQEEAARMAAIEEVLPTATVFETKTEGDFEYIVGYTEESKAEIAGFVVTALGNGFSSTIRTVVGVNTDFTVAAIEIVYQSETPGLGTKAVELDDPTKEPWFERQFDGLPPSDINVDKDGGKLRSITGATITSRAIARSVAITVEKLKTTVGSSLEQEPTEEVIDSTNDIEIVEEGGVE